MLRSHSAFLATVFLIGMLGPGPAGGRAGSGRALADLAPDCNSNGVPDPCDVDCAADNPETGVVCALDYPLPVCGALADCNVNGVPDPCELDCNANGRPEDCDIGSGASADCDSNGVPDECDPDCNGNASPDACDISAGDSDDCDGNGVPDECELHYVATLLETKFNAGLPAGWAATGLWHTTNQCAPGGACNAVRWAYFGQDATCTFATGAAVSGTLSAPVVAIPARATTVTLTYCSAYRGEGGAAPDGFDAAWVAVSGVPIDDAGSTEIIEEWETRTVDLAAYAGQTIALTWNFDSRDAGANDRLGWQVTDIKLVVGVNQPNDCNANGALDECDIAAGASADCNANSLPDECDITAGSSTDCNANGVPDECEPTTDCNANGVPDICEVAVIYVDRDALGGANNGSSWVNAYLDLQSALSASAAQCLDVEIWVAAGTYTPAAAGGARTATFQLRNKVAIYGGFNGTETSRAARNPDPTSNGAVLSGDLAGDDLPGEGRAENCYHVVTGSNTTATAVLDGVTVRGGNANAANPNQLGSAVYISQGSPTLRNCRFTDNDSLAGTVYLSRSSPALSRCLFDANRAGDGCGMFMITNCIPTLASCAFVGNHAVDGGFGYGGAIYASGNCDPTLVNCLFSGNSADHSGGALFLQSTGSVATIVNSTFSRNTAAVSGGGIATLGACTANLRNSILWGNVAAGGSGESAQVHRDASATVTVEYCDVQGLTGTLGGTGNIASNPGFIDDDGADNVVGTIDDDLRLGALSPCGDAGDNGAYVVGAYGNLDLAGLPRLLDDPDVPDTGAGGGPLIDLGAYERQTDCNANGIADALDIAGATSTDCTGNSLPDECEPDCNGNGVADSCDIAQGTAADCDANGVPDDCDVQGGADCNGNNAPDACDIASGASTDCDASGLPDECKTDCNGNGTPDVCENFDPVAEFSGQLAPISTFTPQGFTLVSRSAALSDVTLGFSAVADLGSPDEFIDVDINGAWIGRIFGSGTGDECPALSQEQLVISAAAFNTAVGAGPATITMTASPTVANNCTPTAYIAVSVHYDPVGDCNANGVPDDCDIASGAETDANANNVPDGCEDCNGNGTPDDLDIAGAGSADLNGNGLPDECEDCNANGLPDPCDISCGPTGGACDLTGCAGSADLDADGVPDECQDCNGNFVLDAQDIAAGTSRDCNANGAPDECEIDPTAGAPGGPYFCTADCDPDCNRNGRIDSCDIAAGTSGDCNANDRPDACDVAAGSSADCNGNGVPDECLIELDADGDGVIDECDGCPNDPAKLGPGVCGCGVPDVDSDGDGVADCIDVCPNTPPQTPVDAGGCPFRGGCCLGLGNCLVLADTTCAALSNGTYLGNGTTCATDSDGDGATDCNEECPHDPNKTAPGACGCNQPDTDSDADGVADCLDLCAGTPPGEAVDGSGCSLYGACCIVGVGCLDGDPLIDAAFCTGPLGGVYQGNGTSCLGGCAYGGGGDFDGSGVVDLADYGVFAQCLSGPVDAAGFILPPAQCRNVFDWDGDLDVDVLDYDAFQRAFAD